MCEGELHGYMHCVDVTPRGSRALEAARIAFAENMANSLPGAGPELAAIVPKRWQDGRTLRVCFLDGGSVDATLKQKVERYAKEWSKYANVTFEFGSDPDAEVRIAFQQGAGSWSYIGTDALLPDLKGQPTMNFGWLTPESADDEVARVVLHEFGHALGCIHEHQNPAANIPWDKPKVYQFYAGYPNYWSPSEVDTNLFKRYDREITQFSEFDRSSIMLYPIDARLVTDPRYAVGLNSRLSQADKMFIGAIYPKRVAVARAEAPVGAPEVPRDFTGREGYQEGFLGRGFEV